MGYWFLSFLLFYGCFPIDTFHATITVSATQTPVWEEGGTGEFTVLVSLLNSTGDTLTVPYQVSGSALAGTDYQPLSGAIHIAPQENSASIPVVILNDEEIEDTETVIITLKDEGLPLGVNLDASTLSDTVLIEDNDPEEPQVYTLSVDVGADTLVEGEETTITFSLNTPYSGSLPLAIPLAYTGTATPSIDYPVLPDQVEFQAGDSLHSLTLQVTDDAEVEEVETILLTLDTTQFPQEIKLATEPSLKLFIQDNDEVEPEGPNTWVFILAGQSNMSGRAEIEEQDLVTHPRILYMRPNGKISTAKEPLHNYEPGKGGLGCGMSFARNLLEHLPPEDTILLIPTAIGGTTVNMWLSNVTHKNFSLLTNFSIKVEQALATGSFRGILWYQGESDAVQENFESYEKEFPLLMHKLREIGGQDDLPIVTGELPSFTKLPEQFARINSLMKAAVDNDEHLYWVDADGLTHVGDFYHIDSQGQRLLGRKYAEAFVKIYGLE